MNTVKGIEIADTLALRVIGCNGEFKLDESEKIVLAEFDNGITINVGQKISIGTPPIVYKANHITKIGPENNSHVEIRMAYRTKASVFITPMIFDNRSNMFFSRLLLNCFIATESDKECIAVLYRFSGTKDFLQFESEVEAHPNYLRTEETSKVTTMYIFSIPDKWKEDYDKFLSGKYSAMSPAYKVKLLSFHMEGEGSTLHSILTRDPERQKVLSEQLGVKLYNHEEVMSSPTLEKETYSRVVYDI